MNSNVNHKLDLMPNEHKSIKGLVLMIFTEWLGDVLLFPHKQNRAVVV